MMNAESIAEASLLFVANAYYNDGQKYNDSDAGDWATDMFTFDLVAAYDDYLDGGAGNDGDIYSVLWSSHFTLQLTLKPHSAYWPART